MDPSVRKLIRLCELRLRQDPHDVDALFTKAAVLAELGFHADALKCLNVVCSRVDDYPGIGQFKNRVLVEMRRRPLTEPLSVG